MGLQLNPLLCLKLLQNMCCWHSHGWLQYYPNIHSDSWKFQCLHKCNGFERTDVWRTMLCISRRCNILPMFCCSRYKKFGNCFWGYSCKVEHWGLSVPLCVVVVPSCLIEMWRYCCHYAVNYHKTQVCCFNVNHHILCWMMSVRFGWTLIINT